MRKHNDLVLQEELSNLVLITYLFEHHYPRSNFWTTTRPQWNKRNRFSFFRTAIKELHSNSAFEISRSAWVDGLRARSGRAIQLVRPAAITHRRSSAGLRCRRARSRPLPERDVTRSELGPPRWLIIYLTLFNWWGRNNWVSWIYLLCKLGNGTVTFGSQFTFRFAFFHWGLGRVNGYDDWMYNGRFSVNKIFPRDSLRETTGI